VQDVFGVDATSLHELPRPKGGIGNAPDILVGRMLYPSDEFLGAYRERVDVLAKAIAERHAPACGGPRTDPVSCVLQRLQEPGARLWRQRLDAGAMKALRARLEARPSREPKALYGALVAQLLTSPNFYMLENETAAVAVSSLDEAKLRAQRFYTRRLASRLALVLWSSVPDSELLELAESGALAQTPVLAEQIERMLADARFQRFFLEFVRQWLRLDRPPTFRPSLDVQRLVEDEARFSRAAKGAAHLLERAFRERRPVETLLTADDGNLLTSEAVLTAVSTPIRGGGDENWLGRGLLIQSALLCRTFPLAAVYPRKLWDGHPLLNPVTSEATKRPSEPALLATRTEDRPCRECHRQLETLGAALSAFDGFGEATTTPPQLAAVVAGRRVQGPEELGRWILDTGRYQACVARKLLTYVLGRAVLPSMRAADGCMVSGLTSSEPGAPTLDAWLRRALMSRAFRDQGGEVVRERPTPSPTSNAYLDPLPPLAVTAADCTSFEPGDFLALNCGTSACHGPASINGSFATPDSVAARRLLESLTPIADGYCTDHAGYLDAAHPGQSLLIVKLTAGKAACGGPMPVAGGPRSLNPVEHACFVRWVETLARERR
jgi:hypothetical protein